MRRAPDRGLALNFGQDLSPDLQSLVFATQGATHSEVLGTPIKAAAWHTKPSWFVIAVNDRMISPDQEKDTAKRMGAKTLILPTSHLPMLSQPEKVANFLAEAAASLDPNSIATAAMPKAAI